MPSFHTPAFKPIVYQGRFRLLRLLPLLPLLPRC